MILLDSVNNFGKTFFRILIVTCLLFQAGCTNNESAKNKELETITTAAMYEATKQSLKDPDSAKFRNVRYYSSSTEYEKKRFTISHALCGEINAKNAFGGYVGFKEFVSVVVHSTTSPIVEEPTVVFDDPENDSEHQTFLRVKKEHCSSKELNSNDEFSKKPKSQSSVNINGANVIYYLDGHGERSLLGVKSYDIGEFGKQLEAKGFKFSDSDLTIAPQISSNGAMLVIASPQVNLSEVEARKIKAYLESGGNLLWLLDDDNLHGLKQVADYLGIQVSPGMVMDMAAEQYGADARVSFASMYGEHAITNNFMLRTLFPEAHEVTATDALENGWKASSLLEVAPNGWLTSGKLAKNEKPEFNEVQDKRGPILIGLALERTHGKKIQRVVVMGNANFLSNNFITNGGNLDFGINIVEWLATGNAASGVK